jgi:polyisoprenoid-binding protein YceI
MITLKHSRIFILFSIGFLVSSFTTCAFGQLHPVAKYSSLKFTIRNFGFRVSGSFAPPEGDIQFNPENLSSSHFHVTIKSTSINTDNESRDNHLREEDYLDVAHHPTMSFESESVKSKRNDEFEVTGKLTIKKTTKEITIPFKALKSGQGYEFTGSFSMKRKDFGVGGSSTISDELTVELQVLAE